MRIIKGLDTVHLKSGSSVANALAAINNSSLTLEPLEESEIFIGHMALANDQYDRSDERFPDTYLKRFAETIVGKSVLNHHDYRTDPVGRFFDAEVRSIDGERVLLTDYYMLASDENVPKIKAGIKKHVSIGAYIDLRICDICEKDYDGWWNDPDDEDPCFHLTGRDYKGTKCTVTYGGDVAKVEAVEGSFVYLGALYGAETVDRSAGIGRQAKSAGLAARKSGKDIWALGGLEVVENSWIFDQNGKPTKQVKETKMPPEQEGKETKKLELTEKEARVMKAGERYIEQLLADIEQRYSSCDLTSTGKALAVQLRNAEVEEIEEAMKEAQALFDSKFPPASNGTSAEETKESSGDREAQKGNLFDPLARSRQEYM